MAHLIEWYEGRVPGVAGTGAAGRAAVDADHHDAAHALAEAARAAGVRAEVVEARHSLGARVRRAHERGVPFVGVLGDREVSAGTVTLRGRDGLRLEPMPPAAVVSGLSDLARRRSRELDMRC